MNFGFRAIVNVLVFPLMLAVLAPLHAAAEGGVGSTWVHVKQNAGWSPRLYHAATVLNGKMYVMGGDLTGNLALAADVWSTTDGITWVEETEAAAFGTRAYANAHTLAGEMFIMGGATSSNTIGSDVWSSTNGSTWVSETSTAPWGPRALYGSTVFAGKIWICGGWGGGSTFLNDVWSSTNGQVWTRATDSAGWDARASAGVYAFNNKLWVVGGFNFITGEFKHDVWSSPDGITWTLENGNPPWEARDTFGAVVYQNEMWMLGGASDPFSALRDVWHSANGVDWTRATDAAEWLPRIWPRAVVFDSRIYLVGGANDNDGLFSDVWYTDANATVAGQVTDANTGLPIACAAIRVVYGNNERLLESADLSGGYRIDGIPDISVNVACFAPGYETQNLANQVLTASSLNYVNFSMVPTSATGGVRGRITDVDDGRPIPLVQVDAKIDGILQRRTFTCANGRFEILGIVGKGGDDVQVDVEFTNDGYTPDTQTVDVAPDAVTTADQTLEKSVPAPGALVGVVRAANDDAALEDARVTVQGLGDVSVVTNASGVYNFAALPEDFYTVRASADGYSGDSQLVEVTGLGIANLDFSLQPGIFGDINLDTLINASDVQLVINGALGLTTTYNCDVSKDSVVNAVDVQEVINAALAKVFDKTIACATCGDEATK